MPEPIMPAPSTPTFFGWYFSVRPEPVEGPGLDCPPLMAFRLKKKVLIMFLATGLTISVAR